MARLAVSRAEAAASLGISTDHFERHVAPHLRVVYSGRRRLIPIREIERYLTEHATTVTPASDPVRAHDSP
jgi:hypothetical protein